MLTHSARGQEGTHPTAAATLAELVPGWAAAEMNFAPGEKWAYCQSGKSLSRVVYTTSVPIAMATC